ncbi:MAG: hypothetical protein C0602_12800 [Denitrovibrio sp.]|nr:MAG: hypothetical protein C0602_12800 [Denitrovibrio sp.]
MNQSDIKILKAINISDTDTNGGLADFAAEVVSGVKFNLLPRVTSTERADGKTRQRKAFIANVNQLAETAYGSAVAISSPGNGEDRFYIKAGTDTDTQAELTETGWTGCGALAFNASAGDASIQVTFKANDYTIPESALLLIKDELGNTCNIRTSQSAPCVSWSGDIATIQLDGQLPDNFTAYETNVGVMIETGDLTPVLSGVSVSSAGGSFDDNLITLSNGGTESDTFSITFDSSFSFQVSGVNAGVLTSGTTAAAYEPLNPKTNKPYFSIPAECWSGLFETGNTITFSTAPACKGMWIREVVPAGCAHEPNNSFNLDWLID